MYIYEVYDFDFDDTISFKLLHSKKFTKEEYENIVNACRKKIEGKIKRNQEIIEKSEEEEISEEKAEELELWSCNGEWHLFSNLHKMLIEEYGFKDIPKPLYTFVLNGGFYGKGQIPENRVID